MSAINLFTVAQVAVILGKSERWVRDRVRARELAHVRVGVTTRFTEQQINDYIRSLTRAGTPSAVNVHGRRTRKR